MIRQKADRQLVRGQNRLTFRIEQTAYRSVLITKLKNGLPIRADHEIEERLTDPHRSIKELHVISLFKKPKKSLTG